MNSHEDVWRRREDFLRHALIGSGRRSEEGPLVLQMPGETQRFERHTNPDGTTGAWVSDGAMVDRRVWTTRTTIIDNQSRITGRGVLDDGVYPPRTIIDVERLNRERSA